LSNTVIGVQQPAPHHVSRVGHDIGENGTVCAAYGFWGQDRLLRTLLELEGPNDFLVPGENRGEPLRAGRLGLVAIDVDTDNLWLPGDNPLQQVGEFAIPQRPVEVLDISLGSANEKDPGARLVTGPRNPQGIVHQDLEGLQPSIAANQDDHCDDDVCTDQRLESSAAQQPADALSSRDEAAQWLADRAGHRLNGSAWSVAPWFGGRCPSRPYLRAHRG
jgi:hypothetical protein